MTAQQLGLLLLQHGDRKVVITDGNIHKFIENVKPAAITDKLYIDMSDQIENEMAFDINISIQNKKKTINTLGSI